MLRKYLLPLALALLFALGQQGAMLHEISHVADYSPAGLSADLATKSNQQDKAPHSQVCDKCLGYSQLAGTIPGSPLVLPVSPTGFLLFTHPSTSHPTLTLTSYSARAPPQQA